jgi:hypothetical protein
MWLSPISATNFRVMHVRGDGPTSLEDIQFKANIVTSRKKPIDCEVTLIRDEPTFRSFLINYGIHIYPNEWINLNMSYFWRNTWCLDGDNYSYDVLTWLEELDYEFVLPKDRKITKIEGFLIDIFGREWKGLGDYKVETSSFVWKVQRPPIFCTCIVKYSSIPREIC